MFNHQFLSKIIIVFSIFLVCWFSTVLYFVISYPNIEWNWDEIDVDDLEFPKSFIWGTATAAHQVEGNNTNNNWYEWELSYDENNVSRIYNGDRSGLASDHWNRYPEDIKLMKNLGVNHYRFSIEWSRIEPQKGIINQEAIHHYHELINALINSDITPVITLHHFTHPIWFEELGAFEKEDNIKYFVKFSEIVFSEFSSDVPIWCTINEPAVFVSEGYFNDIFPPGAKNPQLSSIVMKNLLNAHVEVYRHLKAMPNGELVKIGLVKSIFHFDPYRHWHVLDWFLSRVLDNVFTNEPLKFLKTGQSSFYMPGLVNDEISNKDAVGSLDFIGLNYYSRMHVQGQLNQHEPFIFKTRLRDIQTDMGYPMYAEGLHRALHTISELEVPIYITENGLADRSDEIRPLFIKRYLYAVSQALKDSLDIRGYFYWSLMDNFEWAKGYDMKFGLYEVDFKTQERKLRQGSKPFIDIISRFSE
ncbi:MAG: beta-glucosidase [Candidatus Marinimicrobia bacterium]|nr:beta-glucosidase [Candidatus Neomarinimicrobiota bacterium]|tara:strand:+ start:3603 stop:5021 length:1419 start_codon:yes stop_codon:yes gene_type:complete